MLVDGEVRGRQRKLIYWGNRNAFFYVLDRTNGEFLLGRPFAKQTWARGWMTRDARSACQARLPAGKERWFIREFKVEPTGIRRHIVRKLVFFTFRSGNTPAFFSPAMRRTHRATAS